MEIRLPAADDLHIHLRNDHRTADANRAVRHGGAARVLAMPNTIPAIRNGVDAAKYKQYLADEGADFDILTTIKLTGETTPADIADAAAHGVVAVKQYPLGVTTNSDDGVEDLKALYPVYEAIRDHNLILSLHGEVPGVFVMDAEAAFLDDLAAIHKSFPDLRIILEHVTTKAAVDAVSSMSDKVAATITDHHLALTLDDVAGSFIQPHHFCKPLAKRPEDRDALVDVVRAANPSFFSGTDSAPHLIKDKECDRGCAGIFNAPYHMQFLATHFEKLGILDRLEAFTSQFGADFYQIPRMKEEIVLIKRDLDVPMRFGEMAPFMAGETLAYDLEWV